MTKKDVLRWSIVMLTFITVPIIVFLPVLLFLAITPLHDGSDSPGPLLLYSAYLVSAVAGALSAWLTHKVLRRRWVQT